MIPFTPCRPLSRAASASRLRLPAALAALLLGCASASAPRSAPVADGTASAPAARPATDGLEEWAAAHVADAVCDERVVLLGELPEHGEARGFAIKARIVERLVRRCGFRAVLFEAGSYDFFGLERALAAAPRPTAASGDTGADSLALALDRAIGGLWWTRELGAFRQQLLRDARAGRIVLGGLDDQPSATAAYAKATLPALVAGALPPVRAEGCRASVARYMAYGYSASQPLDSAERARLLDCAASAARATAAQGSEPRTPDQLMLDDLAGYFAREFKGADARDRDLVMAEHVAWQVGRLPKGARVVIWTATTHAARGPARPLGVVPLGARLAERFGDGLAVIGFTALQGEWARGGRPPVALAPLPAEALEARALAVPSRDAPATDGAAVPAPWAYLDARGLRALGTVPSRLFGRTTTADWSAVFDGVLVVRDEVAPTSEPRR